MATAAPWDRLLSKIKEAAPSSMVTERGYDGHRSAVGSLPEQDQGGCAVINGHGAIRDATGLAGAVRSVGLQARQSADGRGFGTQDPAPVGRSRRSVESTGDLACDSGSCPVYPPASCPSERPVPMLSQLAARVPTGAQWLYEPKFDGFRGLLCRSSDGLVRLTSRQGKDLTDWFPELAQAG
jgi:hypothetical protein